MHKGNTISAGLVHLHDTSSTTKFVFQQLVAGSSLQSNVQCSKQTVEVALNVGTESFPSVVALTALEVHSFSPY